MPASDAMPASPGTTAIATKSAVWHSDGTPGDVQQCDGCDKRLHYSLLYRVNDSSGEPKALLCENCCTHCPVHKLATVDYIREVCVDVGGSKDLCIQVFGHLKRFKRTVEPCNPDCDSLLAQKCTKYDLLQSTLALGSIPDMSERQESTVHRMVQTMVDDLASDATCLRARRVRRRRSNAMDGPGHLD